MDIERFDAITDSLGRKSSRRGVIGRFAVALGAGAASLVPGLDADARKKRKKKKRGGPAGSPSTPPPTSVCTRGASLGSHLIPTDGSSVSTATLAAGQRYILRASGVSRVVGIGGIDADNFFNPDDATNPLLVFDGCADGTDIGVIIAGDESPGWGGYDGSHIYEREVVGTGQPLRLRLQLCGAIVPTTSTLMVKVTCD